jgi:hypothetical protein
MPKEKEKPQFGKTKTAPKPKLKPECDPNTEGAVTCLSFDDQNVDPLLIVGFESGAISMFKVITKENEENKTII